jgi:hypothetical protein
MSQSNVQLFSTLDKINQKYPIYNEYRAFYVNPDIRKEMVIRGDMPSILALQLDLSRQIMGGNGFRTVRTRKFLSQEISSNKNPWQFTTEAANSAGAAGAAVTVKIKSPYTADGLYVVPVKGHQAVATVKGTKVNVYITDVTENAPDDIEVELTPMNKMALDLTGGEYTWMYNTKVTYSKTCTEAIQKEAFLSNAPMVIEGYVQKYELGQFICEDDLDQYAYDMAPMEAAYFDPMIGKEVSTFCLAEATMNQVREKMIYGDIMDFFFSERDNTADKGFDGVFTVAKKRGKFNMPINLTSKDSVIASLKIIAKTYKNENINSIVLWCDREMMINLNKVLAEIPGYNNFHAPVWSVTGDKKIDWYKFNGINNFLGMNFDIQIKELDGWEMLGYTNVFYNFALIQPMTYFLDSMGRRVPPIEIVKLDSCSGIKFATENGPNGASLWYDDTRQRGGRTLDMYAKNSFGIEVHGAQYLGILSGSNKCI